MLSTRRLGGIDFASTIREKILTSERKQSGKLSLSKLPPCRGFNSKKESGKSPVVDVRI